jgi:sialic acid synthase SpsE
MTKEAKLIRLKTYVRERMDLYNDWSGKSNIKKMFEELETELKEYSKLKSEVHSDIEKVWMFDSSFSLTPNEDIKERSELIEKVFYKIANEWID